MKNSFPQNSCVSRLSDVPVVADCAAPWTPVEFLNCVIRVNGVNGAIADRPIEFNMGISSGMRPKSLILNESSGSCGPKSRLSMSSGFFSPILIFSSGKLHIRHKLVIFSLYRYELKNNLKPPSDHYTLYIIFPRQDQGNENTSVQPSLCEIPVVLIFQSCHQHAVLRLHNP